MLKIVFLDRDTLIADVRRPAFAHQWTEHDFTKPGEVVARLQGAHIAITNKVPIRADGTHDLDAMAAAVTDRTRVVIVCSPNNPTSAIVTGAEFEAFMAKVPESVLVLLDEAYAEFVTDPDAVHGLPLLSRYPNLVVLHTFSKAYGLAGLRVGYAVGPTYILGCIVFPVPLVLVPLASGPYWLILAMLFLAEFGAGLGVMILDISAASVLERK